MGSEDSGDAAEAGEIPTSKASAAAAKLESLGAQCFLKQDERKPKTQVPGTVFEIKFRGPDGVVFDIADTVWKGAAPEHTDTVAE